MTTLIPKYDFKNGGATPTGAVNRPINEKLAELVSVKDFGAVGDGITDDAAAINAALAASTCVYFPVGVYVIKSGLRLNPSGSSIIGSGTTKTTIKAVRASATDSFTVISDNNFWTISGTTQAPHYFDAFTIDAGGTSLTNLSTADGAAGSYRLAAYGIALNYANSTIISNLEIFNTGLCGISIGNSKNTITENVNIYGTGFIPFPNATDANWQLKADGNGITIGASLGQNKVYGCHIEYARDSAFTAFSSPNTTFENCSAYTNNSTTTTNTRGHFTLEASTSINSAIYNCKSDSCTGDAIQITTSAIVVANVIILTPTHYALSSDGNISNSVFKNIIVTNIVSGGLLFGTTTLSSNVSIIGCVVNGVPSSASGITCNYLKNSLIQGNSVKGLASAGSGIQAYNNASTNSNNVYSQNLITGLSNFGFNITNEYGSLFTNNTILGTANSAFFIANANNTIVQNNQVNSDVVSGQSPVLTIRMDTATSSTGVQIKYNYFAGYTTSDASNPYGININTGNLPLVVHEDMSRALVNCNAVLLAAQGSYVRGSDPTTGIASQKKVTTTGTAWVAYV